jgi:hypothetical protein
MGTVKWLPQTNYVHNSVSDLAGISSIMVVSLKADLDQKGKKCVAFHMRRIIKQGANCTERGRACQQHQLVIVAA